MSTKSTLIAVGIIILMLIASFFTGRITCYRAGEDDTIANLTQDSTSVDTLTIVKYDTVYIKIHHYVRADVDTVSGALNEALNGAINYSTNIDTSVVVDSVEVFHLKQSISFSEGMFEVLSKIDIYPIEKIVEVTKTVFRTVKVPVPADPPFYDTFWFGSIFTAIAILLIGLL